MLPQNHIVPFKLLRHNAIPHHVQLLPKIINPSLNIQKLTTSPARYSYHQNSHDSRVSVTPITNRPILRKIVPLTSCNYVGHRKPSGVGGVKRVVLRHCRLSGSHLSSTSKNTTVFIRPTILDNHCVNDYKSTSPRRTENSIQ